jgi:hypothetical protein
MTSTRISPIVIVGPWFSGASPPRSELDMISPSLGSDETLAFQIELTKVNIDVNKVYASKFIFALR